ncbi:hypothetical protein IAG44_32600 [Streptomyces roseirectus]|uniref:DUF6314 domain-containing protein n=1 Tax=Streptomyces roseirectus TaxID=2768066 RepID=A0A7H0ILR8_9ACTN|nr:DUF6314 family protein [Streptomyces roseirectus]QNP73734.1 hypothetical protein IAG44_32600 [Streptomyces roseirectus]
MSEFWPVADVLGYLAGEWEVERGVRDLAGGDAGEFNGTTEFRPLEGDGPLEEGGLLHLEGGTFRWQGVARPASRTLRFLPGPTPSAADVRFSDGRPFHGLDLSTGHHIAEHPCVADLYRGEFSVLSPSRWRTVWRVRGPSKDLLLTTTYTRRPSTHPKYNAIH